MLKGVSSGENKVSHRCDGGEQRNPTTGQPNTSLVGCTIFVQSPFSDLPQSFQFVETDCRAGKNTGTCDTYCADKWCKRKMQGEERG